MVCGVPQGSILGPLLFIVYLNDLDKVNGNYQMLCFADDTNMLHVGADLNLLIPEINSSLKKINDWFSFNKLSLNISKTNLMIFHYSRKKIPGTIPIIEIDNQPLNRVESCKFLGVYIDQNLSWKVHLRVKANQIAKVNGTLCRLKNQLPSHSLKSIYTSLILPHLNYGTTAWGNSNSQELKRIKTLQKKSIRIITHSKFRSHSGPLFKQLKLLYVEDLFKLNCCKIYHKLYHRFIITNILPQLPSPQ
jgi:hypothetical protein